MNIVENPLYNVTEKISSEKRTRCSIMNNDRIFEVILVLLSIILPMIFAALYKWHKSKFIWTPSNPLTNENTKCISEYPKDYRIRNDKLTGNALKPKTMAQGTEALCQRLTKYVLTNRGKYPIYSSNYGVEEYESIFCIKSKEEFKRQAENLAASVMEFEKDYIQKLYSISRKNNTLVIELKVKGQSNTLICKINQTKQSYFLNSKTI